MLSDTMWVNGLKNAFGYDPTLCKQMWNTNDS